MKLDYASARTRDDRRVRRIVLRIIAAGLLLGGLYFGVSGTVVLVLRLLAVGPFSDLRRAANAATEDTIAVVVIAAAGYAVAVAGFLLDRSQVPRRGSE